ncbi:MAG: hypothetical protein EXR29_04365 [Betaproteobacteria bacterium]|nr:hypothetical protein [Betaproteobacteria bacterium]
MSTGQFNALATAMMRSQRVPLSIGVEIQCNPEFVSDEELARLADDVTAQAVDRLSRGSVTRERG